MLPNGYSVEGPISLSSTEFLYVQKTLYFFESLVREEASEQRIPEEILRVLKPCRVCVIFDEEAFYCVACHYGPDDISVGTVFTEDVRGQKVGDIKRIERTGVKHLIKGRAADPITLRFPIRSLEAYDEEKRTLLMPLVQGYLAFELSWAKQRGLITVPKPFFPGRHFTINRDLAFVLMPFAPEFEEIYRVCIKPTLEKRVARCMRADELFHNKPIVEVIWKNINEAIVVVADLSTRNPNVFYEVGMAHTLGKEVVLLTQDLNDVPFDLRHLNVLCYKWTPPGAEKLKASLDATVHAIIQREQPRHG